jgi:hypothetical protein
MFSQVRHIFSRILYAGAYFLMPKGQVRLHFFKICGGEDSHCGRGSASCLVRMRKNLLGAEAIAVEVFRQSAAANRSACR